MQCSTIGGPATSTVDLRRAPIGLYAEGVLVLVGFVLTSSDVGCV